MVQPSMSAKDLVITYFVDEELIITVVEVVFPPLEEGVYFHAGERRRYEYSLVQAEGVGVDRTATPGAKCQPGFDGRCAFQERYF
jgi:hypothetical protein